MSRSLLLAAALLSIAASPAELPKVDGVRAAPCIDLYSARLSREHNDANVICLGARLFGAELALEIVRIFLATPFEGGRHVRRIDKIRQIEAPRS